MKFVNCTPHASSVRGLGTVAPSGIVPRCATVRTPDTAIEGVRVTRQTVGQVTGLPDAEADTIFIVSAMVLGALNGTRPDVFAPDTGADAVRENGQIVEVLGLVQ